MIQFVTFLLFIATGVHPVKLLVDTRYVGAVEVRLDQRVVARLTKPPWEARCDFGPRIRPHVLEAVAYDPAGREMDRIEQWINLPRARAEAGLMVRVVDHHPYVQLTWSEVEDRKPEKIALFLDGEPVPVHDPRSIRLPDSVFGDPHVVRADVVFGPHDIAHAALAFGLGFFDQSQGELTAVPFVPSGDAAVPGPEAMKGWFSSAGEPLTASVVEKGRAEVLIVVAADALGHLPILRRWGVSRGHHALLADLAADTDVRVLLPVPREAGPRDGSQAWLFPFSPLVGAGRITPELLFNVATQAHQARDRQELATAVALAGVEVCASARRRAVVLLLGDRSKRDEGWRAGEIQDFLAELHVPLFVWALSSQQRPEGDWPAQRLMLRSTFRRAAARLRDALESQRVVWLLGHVPPNTVQLSAEARTHGRLAP